jgi:hypothetical protein
VNIVEKEIKNIGGEVTPILENHREENAVNLAENRKHYRAAKISKYMIKTD